MARHVPIPSSASPAAPAGASPPPAASGEPAGWQPMVWLESYSVGHAALDHDHQRLMELINDLSAAIHHVDGEQHDVVHKTLTALRRYIERHFEREERLLLQAGYPSYDEHAILHRNLEHSVQDLEIHYGTAPAQVTVERLHRFLHDWLLNHILRDDLLYSPYLRTLAASQSPQGQSPQGRLAG